MPLILRPPGLPGVTLLLFRREVRARLLSPWSYAIATLICLIAWLYGAGFVQSFETESVLVTTDPLLALNALVVIFLGVTRGLRLASSLAWEREHRTLEVLVVGPVSYTAVVLSKFCVELCVFALLVGFYVLYLLVAQPLGGGVTGLADALSAGRMPLHALPVLALGLLVSAWARTVRAAVVVYLSIVALLALVEAVLMVLNSRPPDQLSLAEAYVRRGLQGVASILDPASAVARLTDLVEGLTVQAALATPQTLLAVGLTIVTLALAVAVSRTRGTLG